jgi:dienelactone hydrolase
MYRSLLGPTVVLVLALGACQATPERNPCADVDCSGHGECLLVATGGAAATPSCSCDTGYSPTPSGMLCLPTTDTSLCAKVTCSNHGKCVSIKGKAQCRCDTGYRQGTGGLSCVDPCQGETCSGHGTCVRPTSATGSISCSCDAGYQPTVGQAGCEARSEGSYLIYRLYYDQYPSSTLGRAALDLTDQSSKGRLVEQLYYRMYFDSWRGLARSVRQVWTLDSSEQQVTAVEIDDVYQQGRKSRQRWVKASFDAKGGGAVSWQRLNKKASTTLSYKGSRRPIPMQGAFEYPGWSLGCFSPAFYIQALQRYDTSAKDPQYLEVFYPTGIQVTTVRVEAGTGATASKPVLYFPEHKIRVTYASGGIPDKIQLVGNNMTWERYSGTPADLNMSPRKSATAFSPAALPTDNVQSQVSFSSSDGTKLAGTLTLPKGASGKVPAVLLVSDLTGYDRDHPYFLLLQAPLYKHLAAHLAHAGYASLRYDPRGGGLMGTSSTTSTKVYLKELVADAEAAHAALAASTGVDSAKIFVLSHGTGSIAALTAIKGGLTARGYAALAPTLDKPADAFVHKFTYHLEAAEFSDKFIQGQEKWYKDSLAEIKAGTYKEDSFLWLPVTLWKDWLAFDGSAAIKAYSGPVLVLRGDEDMETADAQLKAAEAAAKAANKTNLTTKTLKGLGFTFATATESSLWEEAMLPLEVSTAALNALTAWLNASK